MLSTGIRTDVGVKVYGQNLDTINVFAQKVRNALQGIDGVKDLYVEPITGGKYIDITIKRDEIGRYGLSIDDVNTLIESALGGMKLTTTVESMLMRLMMGCVQPFVTPGICSLLFSSLMISSLLIPALQSLFWF